MAVETAAVAVETLKHKQAPAMTPEEEKNLRELQAELVGVSQRQWQPDCISSAFRTSEEPFVFTMQVWIDLDYMRSPILLGRLPQEDPLESLELAAAAFGYPESNFKELTPEEAILIGEKMIKAVKDGFSMALVMTPPEGSSSSSQSDDGFGDWLPILACLKGQLHFSLAEARACPVGAALGLINGHRRNERWKPSRETYAQRDIPNNSPVA
jgi:hypothetical protein